MCVNQETCGRRIGSIRATAPLAAMIDRPGVGDFTTAVLATPQRPHLQDPEREDRQARNNPHRRQGCNGPMCRPEKLGHGNSPKGHPAPAKREA
jgi:hypothetical protein